MSMKKFYVKVSNLAGTASKEFNFKAFDFEHLQEKTKKHLESHEKQWYERHGRQFQIQMVRLR